MENRNGLLVDLLVSHAVGRAERAAAEKMIKRQRQKGVKVKTLGADKGYDTQGTQLAAWWVGAAYNLVRMAKLAVYAV